MMRATRRCPKCGDFARATELDVQVPGGFESDGSTWRVPFDPRKTGRASKARYVCDACFGSFTILANDAFVMRVLAVVFGFFCMGMARVGSGGFVFGAVTVAVAGAIAGYDLVKRMRSGGF